jgi:predicted transcriptional regulator of viral defense system
MRQESRIAARVLALARRAGVLRVRDLTARGINPEYLRRLCRQERLVRTGRGLYIPAGVELSAHHSLAEAAKRLPRGVICLLSALRFHEIGTQSPREVWVAIDNRAKQPRASAPPLRIVRFSGAALTSGVERHLIDGVPVRIYNPAKTVADCFKYRNKIGLDAALEALRDCLRRRKASADELWRYARVRRVANVMRPYLEASL